jgi:iron(III) transport system permease protein
MLKQHNYSMLQSGNNKASALLNISTKFKYFIPSLPWVVGAILLCLCVCFPLFFIIEETRQPSTEAWHQLSEADPGGILGKLGLEEEIPAHSRLYTKTKTTLSLLISVVCLSSTIGILLAWLVSFWQFPLRNQLALLLVLPLTIPSYVLATSFKLITVDYKNSAAVFVRTHWGSEAMIDFDGNWNFVLTTLVLSAAFFPYVYLAAKIAFTNLSPNYLECSKVLGLSHFRSFFKVIMPLSRPAIVGGVMLVALETLNEFGAMKVLGIDTLTTEIFYAWINLEDKNSAIRLSGCIMLILLILLLVEQWLIRGKRFHSSRNVNTAPQLQKITGLKAIAALVICSTIFSLTFLLPISRLLSLACDALVHDSISRFLPLIIDSIWLAGKSSIAVLIASLFLATACRKVPRWWMGTLSKVSTLGYAIPGAIIGICFISVIAFLKQHISATDAIDYLFYGSTYGLVIAYLIRFLAVGFPPIDAGLKQINISLDEAAYSLRHNSISTFWRVHLPLLKFSICAGLIMLFIDILKELPLTLILNPSNHETLATKTYSLFAVEERYTTGSIPAIILVFSAILGLLMLRIISKKLSK